MDNEMKVLKFIAVFEEDPDGGFVVSVPAIPGCLSQGKTFEEAKENIQEAISLCLEDMKENGEEIPEIFGQPILTTILTPFPA